MKGRKVVIIDGDYKGKTGVIIDVYHGWTFDEYTIILDDNGKRIQLYHNEVK